MAVPSPRSQDKTKSEIAKVSFDLGAKVERS
jgi:hypothetical protein